MAPARKKSKFFDYRGNQDDEESDASSSYYTEEEKDMSVHAEINRNNLKNDSMYDLDDHMRKKSIDLFEHSPPRSRVSNSKNVTC